MLPVLDVAAAAPAYAFDARSLIPPGWLTTKSVDACHLYNPAVTAFRGRRLLAYRLDAGRLHASWGQDAWRRIGLCALDEQWRVIPESVTPFSDTITEGGARHYDPRFLVYGDRLFIHYNNNMQTRPNQIYLVEVDADTLCAKGPARPVVLQGPRQEIEKNWMFFEHDGELLAVYTIAPHRVLRVTLGDTGPVLCHPTYTTTWEVAAYANHYGHPWGGAPPVRYGDLYLSVFHSHRLVGALRLFLPLFPEALLRRLPRYPAGILRRLRLRCYQRRYYGGLYAFAATPPFQPRWLAPAPILRPERELPRQRPRWIDPCSELAVYPTGALLVNDTQLLVSYGVHEERCCLRLIDLTQVAKAGGTE